MAILLIMDLISAILVLFVALFHIQVFVMESLLWTSPQAMKAFGTTPKTAEITKTLALNQGVYNLFLAVGLLASFLLGEPFQFQAQLFILGCILLAAITAGFSVSKRIMLIQGFPALTAFILTLIVY